MSRPAISGKPPGGGPVLDTGRPKVHLIRLGMPKDADLRQRRRAVLRRCEEIARLLATSSPEERLALYSSRAISHRDLSIAAAVRPDLMPVVNGEWEWIALTMADLD